MKKKEIIKLLSSGATIRREEIGYSPETFILTHGLENHYLSAINFRAIKNNLVSVSRTTHTINGIGGRLTNCVDEIYKLKS